MSLAVRVQPLAGFRVRLMTYLPQGRHVLDARWDARQRGVTMGLWFHIVALWVFAFGRGYALHDAALVGSMAPIMFAAWLANRPRLGRALRSAIASLALLACAALLTGLWHGATEAHFDFFVVLTLLMLYSDWLPLALALAFVLAHHAVLGLFAPRLVFDHGGSPWLWALIHAGFVLALAAANIVVWRGTENLQHDPDTGVCSRDHVLERARRSVERRVRGGGRRAAVLVQCDIDRLQLVNEGLGRAAGDRMIHETARRLRRSAPPGALVGRYGGDQFVILMEDMASAEDADQACERMLAALATPLDLGEWQVVPSASFGLVALDGSQEADDALVDAVSATESAKRDGGGCSRWFEGSMLADRIARHDVERALRRALDERDVEILYQPIVDLEHDQVVGFEALARIAGSDGTLISPDRFISLAEVTGLIHRLGNIVIDTALRQLAEWVHDSPQTPVWVSINCSPIELAAYTYPGEVDALLRRHEVPPGRVTLEITESALLDQDGRTSEQLKRLHQLGVRLALDDFGAGYSNLGYLSSLPFDKLKIDRAFVSGIDRNLSQRAIVQAVIDMADAVGMHAVAEGVETLAEAELLRRMRCPLGQGYRYGRPMPAGDAAALLSCPVGQPAQRRPAA
jgi:diguanylate cyclase (GGDEF)-like protein